MAVEEAAGDVIVSVAEDSRGNDDLVSEHALGGVSSAVNLWLDLFDNDAFPALFRFHQISSVPKLWRGDFSGARPSHTEAHHISGTYRDTDAASVWCVC